jgi:hypothetical protein
VTKNRFPFWILLAGTAVLTAGAGPSAAPAPSATETPSATEPPSRPLPFGPGEELRFAVKYGVVRAGDASLAVEAMETVDGEPALRLVSTARSSRFFSTFFEVKDRVESLWSVTRRLPLRFEKHIREGGYRRETALRFDHETLEVVDGKGKRWEILPGSQDVLSAFYFVRTRSLEPGDTLRVPNHSDGKNYPLDVEVIRRERVQVPAGTFSCIVVEPLLKTAGLFKQEGRLTIWLTDDSRRMPVLMKSKVAVGSIVAELESFRLGRPARVPGVDVPPSRGDSRP